MFNARTNSAEETQQLAACVADLAVARDLILLVGDLGAGKTAFTQGFGRSLGITDAITSPTFTLAKEYSGRLRLHHLDVYRIEELEEVRDLALPELLEGESVTVIEWGDQIVPALPQDYLEIRLEYGSKENERNITISLVGTSWKERMAQITKILDRWSVR
ncbi:MAG: tRNA (adenosine(37)-N6)-threonylcarbamoyltransferase complex ATPase subunit type 1 TsaE [Acidimicrobiales bacterium]|nr:tRNA (adenosine(37)-N6)-threonylcarbamoyltransferase complex ATPase subunit type 1 TsaE [Acidimicrobiales bacterium]MDG1845059.1 tRNA (adenosine(37)-N6)-threonylcarbamoyltransferase complex ATPase subunit type 1 TsaE [Acidimicrobiales bacterium]